MSQSFLREYNNVNDPAEKIITFLNECMKKRVRRRKIFLPFPPPPQLFSQGYFQARWFLSEGRRNIIIIGPNLSETRNQIELWNVRCNFYLGLRSFNSTNLYFVLSNRIKILSHETNCCWTFNKFGFEHFNEKLFRNVLLQEKYYHFDCTKY